MITIHKYLRGYHVEEGASLLSVAPEQVFNLFNHTEHWQDVKTVRAQYQSYDCAAGVGFTSLNGLINN